MRNHQIGTAKFNRHRQPFLTITRPTQTMSIIQSTEAINGEEIAILIESNSATHESSRTTRGSGPINETLKHAKGAFGSGVDLVRHCAMQVVQNIQSLDAIEKPEEIEVQLAIKLGSDAGALLVSLSGEAQMQVTLKWKFQQGKATDS